MRPTVAIQLRDIAGTLRAVVEEGGFAASPPDIQADMSSLPAALERIAAQAERTASFPSTAGTFP